LKGLPLFWRLVDEVANRAGACGSAGGGGSSSCSISGGASGDDDDGGGGGGGSSKLDLARRKHKDSTDTIARILFYEKIKNQCLVVRF
jgi:hypothetical protein